MSWDTIDIAQHFPVWQLILLLSFAGPPVLAGLVVWVVLTRREMRRLEREARRRQ